MSEAPLCYHCGLEVPANSTWRVHIGNQDRPLCCVGCQAVAQAIVDNGLTEYYRHRDALPESPREALPDVLKDLSLFDLPDFQSGFVRALEADEREADLILEGITCSACVWLNERHLGQLAGVSAVQVNYATRRARVRWHDDQIKLSTILQAVAAIGYRAHPFDPEKSEQLAQKERRTALWRLFVAGFGMMQVMMYAYPAYIAGPDEMTPVVEAIMRWASLILTLPVVLYSAAPFFQRAWRDLTLKRLGMDVPVAIGIGSAFLASLWATLAQQGEVYFDSVTMFVFFLLSGRYLELLARQRAVRGTQNLQRVMPQFARRLATDGTEERVAVAQLAVGDALRVLPGEAIVVDGVVLQGRSTADESWLTGESRAVPKQAGDAVYFGSLNGGSPLLIQAQQVGQDTRHSAIRRLMERAAQERPRVLEQADRIAAWFVAALLLLAAGTALAWWQIDPTRALPIFVSVLVVSCPCALSLATPAALTVATDTFSRLGLLITRGHAIETLARATHFVFDKTGTLTRGQSTVVKQHTAKGWDGHSALAHAAALETHSEHAIAKALVEAAEGLALPTAQNVVATSGQGIQGQINGADYAIGRQAFVRSAFPDLPALPSDWEQTGASDVYFAHATGWLATWGFDDALRPEAAHVITELSQASCTVSLFSGDAASIVAKVAAQVGIAPEHAHGAMTPESKHAGVCALQSQGEIVAMVGDGVNDAPVLAQAQVSIAMAAGADLARNQADIVLLNDELTRITQGRALAQRTLKVVRQNLFWAFAYNFLSVPAAMLGWVSPWMAGLGMGLSSLLVVVNALRLNRVDKI